MLGVLIKKKYLKLLFLKCDGSYGLGKNIWHLLILKELCCGVIDETSHDAHQEIIKPDLLTCKYE